MLGEGRGLSSRPTQDVARDLEIGQPNNSEKCSEAADGVTRESEGGSRLSLLRSVRQDQPRRHSGACLCPVPLGRGPPADQGDRKRRNQVPDWTEIPCRFPPKSPAAFDRNQVPVCSDFCNSNGYAVREASGPDAALRILEDTAEVELLIVDYAMPG